MQHPGITKKIDRADSFAFACHKEVCCFTECCRMLELALNPYDMLRLRYSSGKTSTQLLEQYVIVEYEEDEPFPRFYLSMVDDGRASCVFVSKNGCSVYRDRPAACRTYPLGRAVQRDAHGTIHERFVLIKEPHCHGFSEPPRQTPVEYTANQELSRYNYFNDLFAAILQHDSIKKGFTSSKMQRDLFTLALYDLDRFRAMIEGGEIILSAPDSNALGNDEQLLEMAIIWVTQQLFC